MDSRLPTCRVGADIGGTFTDLVLLGDDGSIVRKKVPSTVNDYAQAIMSGLHTALKDHKAVPAQVAEVVHERFVVDHDKYMERLRKKIAA